MASTDAGLLMLGAGAGGFGLGLGLVLGVWITRQLTRYMRESE